MTNFQKIISNLIAKADRGQLEVAEKLGVTPSYISMFLKGERKLSKKMAQKMQEAYGYDAEELLRIQILEQINPPASDFFYDGKEEVKKHNPTVEDVNGKLNEILSNRNKESNEGGIILEDEDSVFIKRTIVSIKGFAGLKQAFFAEDYMEKNFEVETIRVPKEEAGRHYYKIQVKENNFSMYPKIEPLDWTDCIDIPQEEWGAPNTFKVGRIYSLWHPIKGILFKFVERTSDPFVVKLKSLNEDKVEYPDVEFNLLEFRKIMVVKHIIKNAY